MLTATFVLHNFDDFPKENGRYAVLMGNGTVDTINYTAECGWNTSADSHGFIDPKYALTPEDLVRNNWHTGWLSLKNPRPETWKERIEEIAEEVEMLHKDDPFNERDYSDDDEEAFYSAVELLGTVLTDAIEYASDVEVNSCRRY